MRIGVVLAVLLALASLARAESPLEKEARLKYQAAQKAFDAGRYDEALTQYQASWDLTHYPAIIYRMALCQELLGHREEAVTMYKRYLEAEPESERRATVEARLHDLESGTPPPAPQPPPAPRAIEAAPSVPAAALSATPAPPPSKSVTKKAWFWTVLVLGAGVVATAIAVPLATHYFSEDPFVGSIGSRKLN
jgi:tetratricopeptide (TPR) repeat protein